MENDILDSLEDLGYSGPLLEEDNFNAAIEQGPRSPDYTQLVSWLTESIRLFCGVEEQVNAITNPDDSGNFMLELSGFMREYGCPYKVLSDGPVSQRLNTRESKLQLLDFLTTELASVKMLSLSKPASLKVTDPSAKPSDDAESEVAKHLKMMLIALGFPKPPANITTFQLFSKVESKVKEIVTKDPSLIGKPLLKVRLSDKQWEQVLKINDSLLKDYQTRREMLLKRLDVTIQSFLWSDTAKQKQDKIAEIYQPLRKALTAKCNVGVGRILSARDDLTRIEKTSSGDGRVKCALNRVLIPKVPDRGGRAWEHEPPPPEMPAFQKRDASQQQRPQSGRGGGGGGRGGKVQGGWGDSSGGNVGGQWSQGGGGHRGGGQGHNPSYSQGGGGGRGGGYQGGGGGYQGGGGGYQGGGGGYQGGGGGYQQGGGGYQGGGGGYQQGGGGHNQGGYQDYNQDRRGGGRGGSARGRGRGGRGGR